MNTIKHIFCEPRDVVIETVGDEIILCLNQGYLDERSFSFTRIDVDMFDGNGNILFGLKNPGQFEPFVDFKLVDLEISEIDGAAIATVELHTW